jgi:hypothetical protein
MRRLAGLALRLYPLAFRRRYREEMERLLDERPPRARDVIDLVFGAIWAHVRPPAAAAGSITALERARGTAAGLLACWVAFVVAGLGFYKTTEDAPFRSAGQAHGVLAGAHLAVQILAGAGSLAVVQGALPTILSALGAARRQPGLRARVVLPLLPLVAFAALTGLLIVVSHGASGSGASTIGRGAFAVWMVSGLSCAAACVLACRAVLFSVAVPPRHLRVALKAGVVVVGAMIGIAVASAIYTIALALDSPDLASLGDGPFQVPSTAAALAVIVLVMVICTVLAAVTAIRGRQSWPQLAVD